MPQQTVTLTLGQPIYAQALYYTAMFSQKPFREALLIYREGGTYTILSPAKITTAAGCPSRPRSIPRATSPSCRGRRPTGTTTSPRTP